MNNLKGIIYLSTTIIDFDEKKLQALTHKAAKKNQALNITGYLYFEKNNFLQYIEGESDEVENLINVIENDPRHEVVYIIRKPNITSRNFSSWNMKYLKKERLAEMKLEHIIINQMEFIKKITIITNRKDDVIQKENSVWRIMDTISKFQKKMI